MPQSKSLPKGRYERQRAARQVRRILAAITPSTSHAQVQSPFFTVLPGEIRFQIYQYALCQESDCEHPIDTHSISPPYRPGHTHRTSVDTALLLTCRLVYYEANAIPLRSTTHHFRQLGSSSYLYSGDIRLYHITKQRGAQLYHLHDIVIVLQPSSFSKFLLPHLHWRRISWTICAYLLPPPLPPPLAESKQRQRLSSMLASLVLPASCQEVNLEFETNEHLLPDWPNMQEEIEACQALKLNKADGSVLEIDQGYAVRYAWRGIGLGPWGTGETAMSKEKMRYHTTRLCWRERVPRREYMSYDFLDCLRVQAEHGDVDDVKPLIQCHFD